MRMESNYKIKIIELDDNSCDWKSSLNNKLKLNKSKNIELDCKSLQLTCKDILSIIKISREYNSEIILFHSICPETIVSASALGYRSEINVETLSNKPIEEEEKILSKPQTIFHNGTIRSGELIESNGDLLILGDVNPGAMVRAKGNVMVFGRLLGIAHAGNEGDKNAKISALQLRPVQLRIANKIARGPQEKPQRGHAEQAKIESGSIVISLLETL